jgi:hypothetical protein
MSFGKSDREKRLEAAKKETKGSWFKSGSWLATSDNHRGANEGLSRREIRALEAENSNAYGKKSWWASDTVKSRARQAGHK